jgi:hypothetical protein
VISPPLPKNSLENLRIFSGLSNILVGISKMPQMGIQRSQPSILKRFNHPKISSRDLKCRFIKITVVPDL